jgi:diguanylate cyclase (GGDEF)-like protein/PAS domain S-box-containing protein
MVVTNIAKNIPHILIVDDDPNLLMTLGEILSARGFESVCVSTGGAALKTINGQGFDVALIDLKLDDMSGLEVMRGIKALSPASECILLTGNASQDSAIEAIQMGAFGYFQKPFEVDQVVLSVQRAADKYYSTLALRESEEKYRLVANFTYDWEAWHAPDGTYRYVSPSCERISGHSAQEFLTNPDLMLKITHSADRPMVSAHYHASNDEVQEGDMEFDFRIIKPDGNIRWISHSCTAVFGDDGKWLGRRESNRDITDRKQAEQGLKDSNLALKIILAREKELARTDPLTGINNRRYLFEFAEQQFKVAARYQQPLAVMMFDIDHFKMVNDTFGHAIGDEMLRRVTQIARAELRTADAMGRYGGEEFIVLLPMTTAAQAYSLAERIRVGTASLRVFTEKGDASVTLSIGIVEMRHTPDSESVEEVFRRADETMYVAKQAGRNRIEILTP